MRPTIEQVIEHYRKASRRLRDEVGGDPRKARAFLIRAGVLKPDQQLPPPVDPAHVPASK